MVKRHTLRSWFAGFGIGVGLCGGCSRDAADAADERTSRAVQSGSADEADADGEEILAQGGWSDALADVWVHAIEPVPDEEGVYFVDSFVPALLFQRFSSGPVEEFRLLAPDEVAEDGPGPSGGYRLGAIPPGAPYAALGLKPGDVVESLNGVVLTGPERFGFALDGAATLAIIAVHRPGAESSFKLEYRFSGDIAWMRLLANYAGDPDPTLALADAGAGTDGDDGPPAVAVAGGGGSSPSRTGPAAGGSKAGGGGGRMPSPGAANPGTSTPRPTPSTPGPSRGSPGPGSVGSSKVRCTSSTKCTIEAAHFKSLVANPSRLQSQATIVPAIRNDVFSGYKLKSIKPGSDAAKLGFKPGDKVTHINGHDLTNDAEALQVYLSLGATKLFKIRYERGSSRLVKTVVVQ